jgi:hypothetical protein
MALFLWHLRDVLIETEGCRMEHAGTVLVWRFEGMKVVVPALINDSHIIEESSCCRRARR